jgi:hypothetical protein
MMIGEAPPVGPNFFYSCQGGLFECSRLAFLRVFGNAVGQGEDFLEYFKKLGCYLEDLCEKGTNHLRWESSERREMWENGVNKLARKIKSLEPLACCVIVKGISKHVERAISQSKVPIKHFTALGFPRTKYDPDGRLYSDGLANYLKQLLDAGIIPKSPKAG